ncbi:MAG: hypothetical protein M1828_000098 [Chrysothrix sp. TS-e1954]|nr:MAG: hypothetical protein M1828_000098 [Chrysothrix sp. TS-e1954]
MPGALVCTVCKESFNSNGTFPPERLSPGLRNHVETQKLHKDFEFQVTSQAAWRIVSLAYRNCRRKSKRTDPVPFRNESAVIQCARCNNYTKFKNLNFCLLCRDDDFVPFLCRHCLAFATPMHAHDLDSFVCLRDPAVPVESEHLKNDWQALRTSRGRLYYVTTTTTTTTTAAVKSEKRVYMTFDRNEAMRRPGDAPRLAPAHSHPPPSQSPPTPPAPSTLNPSSSSAPASRRRSATAFTQRLSFGVKNTHTAHATAASPGSKTKKQEIVEVVTLGLMLLNLGVKIGGAVAEINLSLDFLDIRPLGVEKWVTDGGGGGEGDGGGDGDGGGAGVPSPAASPMSSPVPGGHPFQGPVQSAAGGAVQ